MMIDTNFISSRALAARRTRSRITAYTVIGAACGVLTVLGIAWLRSPLARGHELDSQIHIASAELTTAQNEITAIETRLAKAYDVIARREHLTGRPDWGAFLTLVGKVVPSGTFLTRAGLRSEGGNLPVRFEVKGYSPSQNGVSRFLTGLEELQVFDSISLKYTRREPFGSMTGLAFEIQCVASGEEQGDG